VPDGLPHIPLRGPERVPYRYPGTPRDERPLPLRNPVLHAERLLADIESVRSGIRELRGVERPAEARGHLVKARLVPDTPANVDGLGARNREAVVVARSEDGALVHLRQDDLGALAKKIRDYGNPHKHTKSGAQKNSR
jgi:hypothetical protein